MNQAAQRTAGSWSLRRTLLAIFLVLTISVWGFSAVVVYLDADTESQELFDQSLSETAHLLLALADHEVEERMLLTASVTPESDQVATHPHIEMNKNREQEEHSQYLLFQIWDNSQRLMYKSAGAPDAPFSGNGASGLGWSMLNGEQWRTYTAWDTGHRLQIQVGEPSSHRKEISGRFAYKLSLFAVLMLPLMVGAIWWTVNRVFRALQESADEVSRRTPNDLQKINLLGTPIEIHPLLHAINRLFERVSRTLEYEQRFTADAAHELRTPLAAIKTNLQVIQRARNEGERAEAVAGLGTSVDRASRLVEQLMTLARLDPQYDQSEGMMPIDLAMLLSTEIPALQIQAEKLCLHLDADLQSSLCLIHQDSFLILFRNLIDNAFRYTPKDGKVKISCQMESGEVCMRIADSGVGIPADMRDRVFDRFFRLSDANKPGSGLGLSIVKRIVETHQARISLTDGLDGTGLAVEVRFISLIV